MVLVSKYIQVMFFQNKFLLNVIAVKSDVVMITTVWRGHFTLNKALFALLDGLDSQV
jgi:hypothetical protein